jgi:hypothetical protein
VCELIASEALRVAVKPARVAGSECLTGGAFLTVRHVLSQVGVPAEDVSPSTPLASYTVQHKDQFIEEICRIAPGALPLAAEESRFINMLAPLCIFAGSSIAIGHLFKGNFTLALAGVLIFLIAFLSDGYIPDRLRYKSIDFGNLRTFRDLSVAVADSVAARSNTAIRS